MQHLDVTGSTASPAGLILYVYAALTEVHDHSAVDLGQARVDVGEEEQLFPSSW